MTYLCMSWDHRVLDGADAARFLSSVKRRLEGRRVRMNVIERVRASRSPTPLAPAPARVVLDHEEVVVRRGERSGADVIVAIHSTALGPGARRRCACGPTAPALDALGDALRLVRRDDLQGRGRRARPRRRQGRDPRPGGRVARCDPSLREAMLLDFAELVESLDGRYITAEDVGTGTGDMATIHSVTAHVTGLPPEDGGSGDPSPFTAMGVEAAIRACVAYRRGGPELDGLAMRGRRPRPRRLAARRAARRGRARSSRLPTPTRPSARSPTASALAGSSPTWRCGCGCDVLAPCALGGVIDESSIESLGAGIVCGAANNQLADERARRAARRARDHLRP